MTPRTWKNKISFAVIALILWLGNVENADARSGGKGNIYFGGGFLREINSYKFNSTESNFTGWGASGIAGIEFDLNANLGLFFEAEYARHELLNTLQSTTYLEKATNTALIAKAGIYYGMIGLGFAASQNQIDVDNVSSAGTGSRTSFKGLAYHAIGQLTFPAEDRVRTMIEGKLGTGNFEGLTYTESQISIHLYFMPF
ncbi:MAG: hypothetical protein J0L82_14340 [Deltaproteobacteria bacterium]|nr:hypothetical protein [Deltaproteobacteria bacterium]